MLALDGSGLFRPSARYHSISQTLFRGNGRQICVFDAVVSSKEYSRYSQVLLVEQRHVRREKREKLAQSRVLQAQPQPWLGLRLALIATRLLDVGRKAHVTVEISLIHQVVI